MLSLLIFIPLVAAVIAAFAKNAAKHVALIATVAEFALSVYVAMNYSPTGGMQYTENFWWIPSLGISYFVGLDGISLLLILLTTFLLPVIVYSSFGHQYKNPGFFYSMMLMMQSALVGVFCAMDGFLFYVFWELALIPIYLICLMWGGKDRARITLKFFIYTLAGSLLMLVAFIYLWLQTPAHTFSIADFYRLKLSATEQSWLFWGFFLAFAIKMPVFPFHTWQPDTYTDAPTPGTMLLSGIMLKMGIYGVIRWLIPIVPDAVVEWKGLVIGLSVAGIVYASVIAMVQKDFKRLIAYSSIAHVGLIAAGIFALNTQGMQGGVIQMVSHGINVVGLFYIAELILVRTHTREMSELGGIRNVAPQFATAFMIIMLASVALPLTNGFIGEFLLINAVFQYDAVVSAVAGLTIILGAVYMLTAFQKIALGPAEGHVKHFPELKLNEKLVILPLVIMIFWIGLYPKPFMDIAGPSIDALRLVINRDTAVTLLP